MAGSKRIWQTPEGTVCLREVDDDGIESVREFWAPSGGGYVRQVDAQHWGTLGRQVCNQLAALGPTLWSHRENLIHLIRHEYRRREYRRRKEWFGVL